MLFKNNIKLFLNYRRIRNMFVTSGTKPAHKVGSNNEKMLKTLGKDVLHVLRLCQFAIDDLTRLEIEIILICSTRALCKCG